MIKRPWFQLHLSTCIVLMFASGGLSYLNFVPGPVLRTVKYVIPGTNKDGSSNPIDFYEHQNLYGWPMVFCREEWDDVIITEPDWYWNWFAVCIDALTALLSLLAIAFFCEWRIRRRERP